MERRILEEDVRMGLRGSTGESRGDRRQFGGVLDVVLKEWV